MATPKKKETPAQKAARQEVETQVSNKRIADSNDIREKHEANHPERYQGIESQAGFVNHRQAYGTLGYGNSDDRQSNFVHDTVGGMPTASGKASPTTHYVAQDTLPGMEEHPGRVNDPNRWEDLKPHQQERIKRRAAEFGVTEESAHRALGAQVDQAYMHEGVHQSFYTSRGEDSSGAMRPAERIATSAKKNRVPGYVQAVANAITSPKQHFMRTPKSGANAGKRIYPNDMLANSAIEHAQAGTPEDARVPPGMGGFHGRVRAASRVAMQVLGGSTPVKEAWKPGPKTGPYHNSWVDPNGPHQFFVSDTHSGGGGVAPHLPKEQQEAYLNIGGIHSFNDHIARKVMDERGLRSLSGMQSAQWSEERRQRGLQEPHVSEAPHVANPHQGGLFGPEAAPASPRVRADRSARASQRNQEFNQGQQQQQQGGLF